MPKAKADQVIVHRVELQKTEREAMEAYLLGKTATNAVSAVGTLLTPFAGAIGTIVAAWIAKEGAEAAWEKATGYFERQGQAVVDSVAQDEVANYQRVMAYLHTCTSAYDCEKNIQQLWDQMGDSQLVKPKFIRWALAVKPQWSNWTWPANALSSWKSYYPPSALVNDVKQGVKETIRPKGTPVLGWLYDQVVKSF
jgi:hypothetical protein